MASGQWREDFASGKELVKRRRLRQNNSIESDQSSVSSSMFELTRLVTTLTKNVNRICPMNVSQKANSEIVPYFDPEDKNQDVVRWLRKVNELKLIYNWDEKTTIFNATTRLKGLASTWYQSLPSLDYDWESWEKKLQEAFPSDVEYDKQLEEMLRRTKRKDESMMKYFYDKLALLNVCEISGKKAVACIIGGIPDATIKAAAKVKEFAQPEGLLRFLKTLSSDAPKSVTSSKREVSNQKLENIVKRKCYGCGSRDHILPNCPMKISNSGKKTYQQNRSQDTKTPRQVLTMEETDNPGNKYFKQVLINDVCVDAYIDLGATCNVIKEEVLVKIKVKRDNNAQWIKGYGSNLVEALGTVKSVLIKIDDIEATTDFLVVPNHFQKISAIIGQPVTEQDHIIIYKDVSKLLFLNKDVFQFDVDTTSVKTKIKLNGTVVIPPQHGANIACDSEENGIFFIRPSIRMKENNEYFIPASIIQTNNQGKCFVPVINPTDREIVIKPKNTFARATKCTNEVYNIMPIDFVNEERDSSEKFKFLNLDDSLSENDRQELLRLLRKYETCFASSLSELGCTKAAELKIELVNEKAVVYRPYRMSPSGREKVREIVSELLQQNIIRESSSPFSSPVLLVKKKNGDQRLCIDYRMVNSKIKQDHFPLPRIDDQLDYLQGNKYFTSLDMISGYYQIPVAESSKYITAFVTPDGQYEFNRMPFGISTAPAVFQRMVNKILGPLRGTVAVAYLDDILIPSKDFDQGLNRLEQVLNIIKHHNLTLNPEKCEFFKTSITYLGFEIDSEGIKPGLKKTKCIENFSPPRNVHQIRQFLGLTGFFRHFVKDYALISRPLTDLTKKDSKWIWGEDEQSAFSTLKRHITSRPVLRINKNKTEVHTDASKIGLAGILFQRSGSGKLHPVSYYSRRTTIAEEKYHSYELETLAVVETLKKFRVYLLDSKFKVVTDCNSIKMAAKKKDLVARIARWWLCLQEFNFTIEYRPGNKMSHVDALSRNPDESEQCCEQNEILHIEAADWVLANQLCDEKVSFIHEILQKQPKSDYEKTIHNEYKLENGRIYKITNDGLKWMVPKGMRNEVVRAAHDALGHFGVEKTLKKVNESYWFPQMKKYVERYIKSCIPCLFSKQPKGKAEGYLNPIDKVPEPFHTIHMDHLGPFVKSTTNKKYIIVCVDAFTKFILLRAVKDTKTKPVINFLDYIISVFGVPKRIITDQGTCYTSKMFEKYCENKGLKHIKNAVATPRANGQVERYNSTILTALKALTTDNTKWDRELTTVQFGLNNTEHSITKKTPSELLLGYKPLSPADSQLHSLVSIPRTTLSDRRKQREEVTEKIRKSQSQQKYRYDLRRKPARKYKIGQIVLVKKNISTEGESKKLQAKYKGPFRIAKRLRNDRYVIAELPGSHRSRKTTYKSIESADRMKPWIPPGGKSESSDDEEDAMNEDVH